MAGRVNLSVTPAAVRWFGLRLRSVPGVVDPSPAVYSAQVVLVGKQRLMVFAPHSALKE